MIRQLNLQLGIKLWRKLMNNKKNIISKKDFLTYFEVDEQLLTVDVFHREN